LTGVDQKRRGDSGQAAVETALTMPMLLFIVMSVLQLGLLMQARNLTQYAVFRATRAGSLNHGECKPMMHSAIASLIPSFVSFIGHTPANLTGSHGAHLGEVFRRVGRANRFDSTLTVGGAAGFDQSIVWLVKERPQLGELTSKRTLGFSEINNGEYSDWDQGLESDPIRLEVRIVYWYPLRLPFIDWVLSRIILAHWGLVSYDGSSVPYAPTQTAGVQTPSWSAAMQNPFARDYLGFFIRAEMLRRYRLKQYSFPILASSRMRMMTPPRTRYFQNNEVVCGFP
jgi:hypothetical protein